MTLLDRLIPYYVWFLIGFATVSLFLAAINYGVNILTLATVKGLTISIWLVPFIVVAILAGCTIIGWFFEKGAIQRKITSHLNQNMNDELDAVCKDVKEIKRMLEAQGKI